MALRQENLRVALLKAIVDTLSDKLSSEKEEHLERLLEHYEDTLNKSFEVALPDSTKIGTISLTASAEKFEVGDEVALLEWAKKNEPQMVHTVTVPPQPAQTFEEVDPRSRAALLKRVTWDPQTKQVLDGDLPVDGIKHTGPGRPKGFSVRLSEEGRTQLLDHWAQGHLSELTARTPLPLIESDEVPPWER